MCSAKGPDKKKRARLGYILPDKVGAIAHNNLSEWRPWRHSRVSAGESPPDPRLRYRTVVDGQATPCDVAARDGAARGVTAPPALPKTAELSFSCPHGFRNSDSAGPSAQIVDRCKLQFLPICP